MPSRVRRRAVLRRHGGSVKPTRLAKTAFGVLQATAGRAQAEWDAGLRIAMLEIRWDKWETSPGVWDTNGQIAADLATFNALRARGFQVALGVGLHYVPAWLSTVVTNPFFTNQAGVSTTAGFQKWDFIFNQAVRSRAENHMQRVADTFGAGNITFVRVTSGGRSEVLYPETSGTYDYWAFGSIPTSGTGLPAGIPVRPFQSWTPGTVPPQGVSPQQFADWYIGALSNVIAWQMNWWDGHGFKGVFELLMPGRGLTPSGVASAVAANLPVGTTTNALLGAGVAYETLARNVPAKFQSRTALYSTSVGDGSSANVGAQPGDDAVALSSATVASWSASRVITRYAHAYNMRVHGENPGLNLGATPAYYKDTSATGLAAVALRMARENNLDAFYWAHEGPLFDTVNGIPLAQYTDKVQAIYNGYPATTYASVVSTTVVPPVAAVAVSPSVGTVPFTVTASATGSTPGSAPIASYAWSWGDGTSTAASAAATATHQYASAGSYPVTVTVTDGNGQSAQGVASVTANAAPVGFTPASVAGLAVWLKADALTGLANGAGVASWPSSTGTATATQATVASQPAYVAATAYNGLPAVRFNGASMGLGGAALTLSNAAAAVTVVVAASASTTAAGNSNLLVLFGGTGVGRFVVGRVGVGGRVLGRRLDADASANVTAAAGVDTSPHIWRGVINYSGNSAQLALDGAVVASTTAFSTAGNASATNSTAAFLGSGNGNEFWAGDIQEVCVWPRALTGTELGQVEAYLSAKYPAPVVTTPVGGSFVARRGVNSAGQEFGTRFDNINGTYDTDASFAFYAARNHEIVRIPVLWERIQTTPGGALAAGELGRLKAAVASCTTRGMVAVIDVHNYFRYQTSDSVTHIVGDGTVTQAHLVDLWTKLSTEFKGNDLAWYGLMNEPHDIPAQTGALGAETLTNGGFETNTAGWASAAATIARVATPVRNGTGALGVTATTTATNSEASTTVNVTAGSSYTTSLWVRGTRASNMQTVINWFGAGNAYLSTSTGGFITLSTTAYTQSTTTATAPAGAVTAQVIAQTLNPTAGDVTYLDDASVKAATANITGAQVWERAAQACVDAIRNNGDTSWITVAAVGYSSAPGYWSNHPTWFITDPIGKSMPEGHFYFDADSSGSYAGTYAAAVAQASSEGFSTLSAKVASRLKQFTDGCASRGLKPFIGEYGWMVDGADAASWAAAGNAGYVVLDAAQAHVTYWSAGELWGNTYRLSAYRGVPQATTTGATATIEAHPSIASTTAASVFADEFTSASVASPSSANWVTITGQSVPGGPANFGTGERETFTASTNNLFVGTDGYLHLKAIRDASGNWTSGRIESKRSDFRPAAGSVMRVEARLNLPLAANPAGVWPAFWMLGEPFRANPSGWPGVGELDIMESVNGSGTTYGTMHAGVYAGGPPFNEPTGMGGTVGPAQTGTGIHGQWHVYALEWDRSGPVEQLRWYYDTNNFYTIRADQVPADQWARATQHGYYIILNLAVGGSFPDGVAGSPTPTAATTSPFEFLIDYVRVTATAGLEPAAASGGFTSDWTSGNVFTGKWLLTGAPTVASTGVVTMPVRAGYPDRLDSVARFDLRGQAATVKTGTLPTATSGEAFLQASGDYSNNVAIGKSGNTLVCRITANNVMDNVTIPWDGAAMVWWRLNVASTGAVTWQTSPDSTTWTTRRTATAAASPDVSAAHFALLGGHFNGADPDQTATFTNGSVAVPPATLPPGTITHGSQINTSNTGHLAYVRPSLGRVQTAADMTVVPGNSRTSDYVGAGTAANPSIIEGRTFNGSMVVDRDWVTFRGCYFADTVISTYAGVVGVGANFEWCTIQPAAGVAAQSMGFESYTMLRCQMGGGSDGLKLEGGQFPQRIVECYIRVNSADAADHNDVFQNTGGIGSSVVLRCNCDDHPANGLNLGNSIFQGGSQAAGHTYSFEIADSLLKSEGVQALRFYDGALSPTITYSAHGNIFVRSNTIPMSPGGTNTTPLNQITWYDNKWDDGTPITYPGTNGIPAGGTTTTPPTAALTVTPTTGNAPLTVTANASASTAGTSAITTYSWAWGDGTSTAAQAGASASHTYSAAGTYTVTVTVTDSAGRTGTKTATVAATTAGSTPASTWVRRTAGVATENGTTTHTLTFAAASTGNLLVAVVAGSVTSTPGAGWTTRLNPVNNTQLLVATKTATAGETTMTVTHNAANYPANWVVYEFAGGSTWAAGVGATNQMAGVFPALAGLSGTNFVFAAHSVPAASTDTASTAAWASPWVGNVDQWSPVVTNESNYLVVGVRPLTTGASVTPTSPTFTPLVVRSAEVVTFAINAVA